MQVKKMLHNNFRVSIHISSSFKIHYIAVYHMVPHSVPCLCLCRDHLQSTMTIDFKHLFLCCLCGSSQSTPAHFSFMLIIFATVAVGCICRHRGDSIRLRGRFSLGGTSRSRPCSPCVQGSCLTCSSTIHCSSGASSSRVVVSTQPSGGIHRRHTCQTLRRSSRHPLARHNCHNVSGHTRSCVCHSYNNDIHQHMCAHDCNVHNNHGIK